MQAMPCPIDGHLGHKVSWLHQGRTSENPKSQSNLLIDVSNFQGDLSVEIGLILSSSFVFYDLKKVESH